MPLQEFLYIDPDTGMVVCMIADEDGFRPASACEELQSRELRDIHDQAPLEPAINSTRSEVVEAEASIDDFVNSYERSYGPAMA